MVGVGFAGYALYKKLLSTEEGLTGNEDLELPLALEHDYGDFRGICGEADSEACSYLNELPESYFHFNTNLASYILTQFSEEVMLVYLKMIMNYDVPAELGVYLFLDKIRTCFSDWKLYRCVCF